MTIDDFGQMQARPIVECEKQRFYDELMAHIIVAGGARIDTGDLANKSLKEVVDLIWPNGLRLSVSHG